MLGINDPMIYTAYLLSILCLLFCIWYGIKNWNKGNEVDEEILKSNRKWETEEKNKELL